VPQEGDWVNDFLEECYAFTGIKDAHDDQIDALAHAWNVLTALVPTVKRGVKIAPARYGLNTRS
jgi:phage terminase large subunit-like protein